MPTFRYKQKKQICWQYLASARKTNGVFDDFDTSLASVNVSATAAIDNNAIHYYDGIPNVAITGGVSISTIEVKNLSGTPRICGRIKLTNENGQSETINYNGVTLSNSIYTFTLADSNYVVGAQTPTYSYNTTTSTARVLENPIVKDSNVNCTNKSTGLFIITLDCNNIIYQDTIEGSTEISGTVIELTVINSSLEDVYVHTIPVRCLYKLDDDGNVAPAPDKDYLTDAENELKYNKLVSNPTNGHILTTDSNGQATDSGVAISSVLTNPMTTAEDIIIGGTNGVPTRKSKGSDGTYLGVVDGVLTWTTPAGAGDVVGPSTNTDNYVPQWDGNNSKALKNGRAIGVSSGNIVERSANNTIAADAISEITTGNGVTIDGLNIKDGGFNVGSDADGDIYYRSTGVLTRLPKGSAGQVLKMNSAGTAPEWSNQVKTVYIDAGAMLSCTTSGAEAGKKEYASDKPELDYFAFDATTSERVQFKLVMPNTWNTGTVTAKFYWSSATGSSSGNTVEWGIKALALNDNDTIATAFGTAQTVSDTLLADNGAKMQITSSTPAMTIGGTPSAGSMICFEVFRNVNGNDNMTVDAYLFGVEIIYGV
ncbi:MAG: hypothetical protein SNJ71_00800 [Bacteroidales bacterium]